MERLNKRHFDQQSMLTNQDSSNSWDENQLQHFRLHEDLMRYHELQPIPTLPPVQYISHHHHLQVGQVSPHPQVGTATYAHQYRHYVPSIETWPNNYHA